MRIDILADPPPAPIAPPPPRPARAASNNSLLPWILLAAVALYAFRDRLPIPDIDPGPKPTPIVVDQPSVLFATNGTNGLSVDQAQATSSAKVRQFADDNQIALRRYDVADDLTTEEKHWQDMMQAAKQAGPPKMVTVTKDGKGTVADIPAGVDQALDRLRELQQTRRQ